HDVNVDEFYRAVNRVEPSLIRIEADEVTYNLHIILRFELEKALLSGELAVADLPGAWRDRMKELLGISPQNDSEGVLQDIHWSAGLFGYFPTYALGNLYGAQFAARIRETVPDLDNCIEKGDFLPFLKWHRKHIHSHGRIYSAGELCEMATGKRLDPAYFVTYLKDKFTAIYEL
ncbi:MAG: carboxypeptidase M32, partial [Dehalococcoidales bacterium]|nr:carboxypeptidase M32 [Dehalococcoidales bacterium]